MKSMLTETGQVIPKIRVVDFFCGCGGSSAGLRKAQMQIVLGIDNDPIAGETYYANFPEAHFIGEDIRKIKPHQIESIITSSGSGPLLFNACAPCQPFSNQNNKNKLIEEDSRFELLGQVHKFVKYFRPDYILLENVPGIQNVNRENGPLAKFLNLLNQLQYSVDVKVLNAADYGVPQARKRLILMACRNGEISFPKPSHGPNGNTKRYSTVREWIYGLPKLKQGEVDNRDKIHQAAEIAPINLERLSVTPEGRGRECWPEHLVLACHKKFDGHTDTYGRLQWDAPARTLTTKCTSISNGRFGHPEQLRAISAREAACLQTFDKSYKFKGTLRDMARQIGNAVPVLLAKKLGMQFVRHYHKSLESLEPNYG